MGNTTDKSQQNNIVNDQNNNQQNNSQRSEYKSIDMNHFKPATIFNNYESKNNIDKFIIEFYIITLIDY